jgi:hypothetical protein
MKIGMFGVIAGPRLGGKTTLAGTLPGSTLLLQAALLETGSRSAQVLAKKRNADLTVETFRDLTHLRAEIDKIKSGEKQYDNYYFDGLSAITDLRYKQSDIQQMCKKNVWEGFGKLGEDVNALLLEMKEIADSGANVFITCALKVNKEGGDVELETKGKMAVTAITKLGEAVLTVMLLPVEGGGEKRMLITKSAGQWPGRIDGILDEDNPGIMEPDLTKVLALLA